MPNMHQPEILRSLVILFTFVILSEAKDLVRCTEMLRCTQHDNTSPTAVRKLMPFGAD
jgi:hypothetical protein